MLASKHTRLLAMLLCAVVLSHGLDAQEAKLEALLKRSPSPPNAIGYLHLPSLKKLMSEANIPSSFQNDDIEEVWLLSDLDTVSLNPKWEAGYATMKSNIDADALAAAMKGYVDMIGDKKVVWTPRQTYLLPVDNNSLGFLRPANRSLMAEWINSASNNAVPDYLAAQAKQPEQFLSLMVAINLKDTFSPVALASRAKDLKSLTTQDPAAVGQLLASARGLSLIVGRKSLSECILSVDFGQSPASLTPVAAAVLDEILKKHGVAAPEVASWKVAVNGNKLSFQGPISADSLDGVLGIFSISNAAEKVSETIAAQSQPAEAVSLSMGETSKQYFDKVNAFIERVRKYEAQTTGYRAKWDEIQARRIEEISTLRVDPLMIDYGANVANMLRGNATSIRSGNVAAGQEAAAESVTGRYNYGYGGGYYGGAYSSNFGYRSQADVGNSQMITGAQQRMAGFGSYQEIIAAIDKLTGEVRRAMTAKYQIQF